VEDVGGGRGRREVRVMSLSMERGRMKGKAADNRHKHKLTFMVALSEERRPPVNCV